MSTPIEITPPNLPTDQPRRGRYLRTDLVYWHCGDPECDCWEPQIVHQYEHGLVPGFYWPEVAWHGTYYSQPDAAERAEQHAELWAALKALHRMEGIVIGSVTLPTEEAP